MTMKRFFLAVFSIAMIFFFQGGQRVLAANFSAGKGTKVVRTFSVKDFSALQLSGDMKVVFTQGPLSVKAKAPAEQLKYLKLRQENGRLSIETKYPSGIILHRKPIFLYVSAPQLADLSLSGATEFNCVFLRADNFTAHISGASEAKIKAFEGKKVKVVASGASELTLKGNSQTSELTFSGSSEGDILLTGTSLTVVASGASDVDVNFIGTDVKAKASGSSDIDLDVNCRMLDINCSGASDVEAKGVASKRTLHKSGAASIDVSKLNK